MSVRKHFMDGLASCPTLERQLLEGFMGETVLSDASAVEHCWVFCAIWAFGSALAVGDDGLDYRTMFSKW